ncbi:metallophosphoesterase [Anabaena azotica]|uniref:Metallophosphoesterase n=1 Tax=Anabaena azotica FACHB-119 TaxID=947527 RepID=A0ABR8DBU6_9NOST|nr:metallophosphoesterase [Anabaena azotica]MBD2504700.1 metallophosphoesterase [Anabaena azotica FACHB-119]
MNNSSNCNYFSGGSASLYVVFADSKCNLYRNYMVQTCIDKARELRKLGFDALVFPGDIPDYIPVSDEVMA